jgi:hypothetical protein
MRFAGGEYFIRRRSQSKTNPWCLFNTCNGVSLHTETPRVLGQSSRAIGLYLTRQPSTAPIVRSHYQRRFWAREENDQTNKPHKQNKLLCLNQYSVLELWWNLTRGL